MPPVKYLIADKGYDSNALRDRLKSRGTVPVIPPRSNRKVQLRYNKSSIANAIASSVASEGSRTSAASLHASIAT